MAEPMTQCGVCARLYLPSHEARARAMTCDDCRTAAQTALLRGQRIIEREREILRRALLSVVMEYGIEQRYDGLLDGEKLWRRANDEIEAEDAKRRR